MTTRRWTGLAVLALTVVLLAAAPSAHPGALRQAERAISSTPEHHAHVRLRAAA